ncbi:MAG: [LysW]-aminoadipate/[LysW]-glutamate kinase [Candidatus Bathyarchaeia archaeon]
MLIVVKAGGNVLKNNLGEIASDVGDVVHKGGNSVIFVHGGGAEVTAIAEKLGQEQKFVISPEGFRSRYTDKDTVEIYNMVMSGKINKKIVSVFQSCGVRSIGLSGVDGGLLKAKRKERMIIVDERGRKKVIDAGFSGKIHEVNSELLKLLIGNGYVPVISPVAIGEEFELLNVDGDRAAASIAGAVKADKLVLLTDVEGVILDGKVVPITKSSEIKEALPKIGAGMSTKVHAAAEALNIGVKEVIISSGLRKSPITSAIRHENGTVIVNG